MPTKSNNYFNNRHKKRRSYRFTKGKNDKQELDLIKMKNKIADLYVSKITNNGQKDFMIKLPLYPDPYSNFRKDTVTGDYNWTLDHSRYPMKSIQSGPYITKMVDDKGELNYYNLLLCDNDLIYINGPIKSNLEQGDRKYYRLFEREQLPEKKPDYSHYVRDYMQFVSRKYFPKNNRDGIRKAPAIMLKYRTLKKQKSRHDKREKERKKKGFTRTKRRVKDFFRRKTRKIKIKKEKEKRKPVRMA